MLDSICTIFTTVCVRVWFLETFANYFSKVLLKRKAARMSERVSVVDAVTRTRTHILLLYNCTYCDDLFLVVCFVGFFSFFFFFLFFSFFFSSSFFFFLSRFVVVIAIAFYVLFMCELTSVISRNEVNKVFGILCSINLVVTRDAVSRPTTRNVFKCRVLMRGAGMFGLG